MHAEALIAAGGAGPYLKGLEETSPSSRTAAAPVLQLVLVSHQAHHGLAVDVQLLIQGLQQGRTRSLLATTKSVSGSRRIQTSSAAQNEGNRGWRE